MFLFTIEDARANKGAKLLDRENPNWFKKVDVERLHIPSPSRCVLGQVYGLFSIGLDALHMPLHRTTEHGFVHSLFGNQEKAWKKQIEMRLNPPPKKQNWFFAGLRAAAAAVWSF